MKYTYETLNEAIYIVIPEFKIMSDNGIVGNQPMMLKSVCERHFIESAWEDNRDYVIATAYDVCKQAMIDLNSLGHFNFSLEARSCKI